MFFNLSQVLTIISMVLCASSAFWLIKSEVKKINFQELETRRLTKENQRSLSNCLQVLNQVKLEAIAHHTQIKQMQIDQSEFKRDIKKLLSTLNSSKN